VPDLYEPALLVQCTGGPVRFPDFKEHSLRALMARHRQEFADQTGTQASSPDGASYGNVLNFEFSIDLPGNEKTLDRSVLSNNQCQPRRMFRSQENLFVLSLRPVRCRVSIFLQGHHCRNIRRICKAHCHVASVWGQG
jgi:hypothetical protein